MSEMKTNSRPTLAPTWQIVMHLLGAAVMLYFVSDPKAQMADSQYAKTSLTSRSAINVAELDAPSVSSPTPLKSAIGIKNN